MAITTAQKNTLNNMCISANSVGLGTLLQTVQTSIAGIVKGTHTVSAAEETAGTLDIASGLTAITGFIVQVYRANLLISSYDVQASAGTLTIATNSTDYVVTENDVVNYIIF